MVLPVSVSCGRCTNLGRDKLLRADQEFGETGLTTVLKVLGCKASKAQHVDPTLRSSALWILPTAPAAVVRVVLLRIPFGMLAFEFASAAAANALSSFMAFVLALAGFSLTFARFALAAAAELPCSDREPGVG